MTTDYHLLHMKSVTSERFFTLQLDHLQHEADRLATDKPEEAAVIQEKIVLLTDVWQELKQMVCIEETSLWLGFFFF